MLSDALVRAQAGGGSAVFLTGGAGIGKSALARAVVGLAAGQGVSALVGRAVPRPSPMPYRALTEALLTIDWAAGLPADAALAPFRPALSRLVPQWRVPGEVSTEESPVVLGAGLLKLLRARAPAGSLLVLDDLHWADPDTTAVVEYLCDNLASEPVTVLGTLRDSAGTEAHAVVEALHARGNAQVLRLEPLDAAAVTRMLAACELPAGTDPTAALELVAAAEGVPLFVEELLSLPAQPGPRRRVPTSVAETVRLRLADLDRPTLSILGCAALLGRRFDWSLLAAATGLDEDDVLAGLQHGVAVALIDNVAEGFQFRHALVRDAVLASMLAPRLQRLAATTLAAVERAHPGLPDEWCVLAADLAEEAGQRATAAGLLVVAGRRALQQAALASAERLLRRAAGLATPADGLIASELLAEVLAAAGRVEEAVEVVEGVRAALAGGAPAMSDPMRVARLTLVLARAAVAAERWALADEQLAEVRAVTASGAILLAEVTAVAAQVAIGRGEIEQALRLARDAVAASERAGRPEAACEAWEVVGRAERPRSLPAARAAFEHAAALADAHDLVLWRLRATHELGTIELFTQGRVDTLEHARGLADRCGALRVAAVLDLQLAGGYILAGRGAEATAAGHRAADTARRLHFPGIERAGTCFAVIGHAQRGDLAALTRAASGVAHVVDGDPVWVASLAGDGFGMCALLNEDRRGAVRALERAAETGTSSPERAPSPWWGLWPLLRALRGGDARQALAEAALVPVSAHNTLLHGYTEAVLLGRDGKPEAATHQFHAADTTTTPESWRHLARRLVAEAALQNGWGDPVGWLTPAAEFFDRFPAEPVAAACRSLLRRAGAPTTRPPVGVPTELAELGVTGREAEVLGLLGLGLSNRDLAARLYLSPRTVEKHVENLTRKIGVRSRYELVAYAAGRDRPE